MITKIDDKTAQELGITTNHTTMDNGEKRFRLQASDGTSYIRIESATKGAWQNSHSHSSIQEICIVQKGWLVFAEETATGTHFKKFSKNDYFITKPKVPHNVYMSKNSIIHTVKFGDIKENDWIPHPPLDAITQKLSQKEALKLIDLA